MTAQELVLELTRSTIKVYLLDNYLLWMQVMAAMNIVYILWSNTWDQISNV